MWRGFVSSSKPLGRNFRVRASSSFGAVAFVFHAVIIVDDVPVHVGEPPFSAVEVVTEARVLLRAVGRSAHDARSPQARLLALFISASVMRIKPWPITLRGANGIFTVNHRL